MMTAHVLIKNEEYFVWYSVLSVIDFVDKVLIWDTGSTDNTKEIVKEIVKIYGTKIDFKEIGEVDKNRYSEVRQRMLDETKTPWVFILDGDEIWFRDSVSMVINKILAKRDRYESVVVPTINLVGDIFHYQGKAAGEYKFGKRMGHYALRFVNRNISGLHIGDAYGKEGFFDKDDRRIQEREENKILFVDAPYIHATHLQRSNKDKDVMQRSQKMKHEIGIGFPKDFYYPESLFMERPEIVPNIWKNMNLDFRVKAYIETPLRKLKRRIF